MICVISLLLLLNVIFANCMNFSSTFRGNGVMIESYKRRLETLQNQHNSSQCLETLARLGFVVPPHSAEVKYCNGTWDGIMCWPPVVANSNVSQSCTSGTSVEWDTTKMVTKHCNAQGYWSGKTPFDPTPFGHTNYDICIKDPPATTADPIVKVTQFDETETSDAENEPLSYDGESKSIVEETVSTTQSPITLESLWKSQQQLKDLLLAMRNEMRELPSIKSALIELHNRLETLETSNPPIRSESIPVNQPDPLMYEKLKLLKRTKI